jgi:hypothetical protein
MTPTQDTAPEPARPALVLTDPADGREYAVPPLALPPRDFLRAVREQVKATQRHPADALAEMERRLGNNTAALAAAADAAFRAVRQQSDPTPAECEQWLLSDAGVTWLVMTQLRQQYPTVTAEQVERMLAHQAEQEMRRRQAAAAVKGE